jgi:ectoine hydroxylase-related dioxygenase (phytanoyl-CoA dioxygenase family)
MRSCCVSVIPVRPIRRLSGTFISERFPTLIYLDDIDEATGPLCVVPGTHLLTQGNDLLPNDYEDKDDQVVLYPSAGTCIPIHGALWHRAKPVLENGRIRRLLILQYSATWMKQNEMPVYESLKGWPAERVRAADPDTRELLGLSKHFKI